MMHVSEAFAYILVLVAWVLLVPFLQETRLLRSRMSPALVLCQGRGEFSFQFFVWRHPGHLIFQYSDTVKLFQPNGFRHIFPGPIARNGLMSWFGRRRKAQRLFPVKEETRGKKEIQFLSMPLSEDFSLKFQWCCTVLWKCFIKLGRAGCA